MKNMPRQLKLYISMIIVLGLIFAILLKVNYTIENYGTLILFVILSFIVESLVVPLPGGGAVSLGYAICLSSMIIIGPLGAAICGGIGIMLRIGKPSSEPARHIFNTPFYKTLFNGAQCLLTFGIASLVYYSFGMDVGDRFFYINIIPFILSILTCLFVNTLIVTKLMSMINSQSFFRMFVKNIIWTLPNSFVIASLGIFISILYLTYGTVIMLLFFGPLLLARHSFKLYLEMKEVYIETVYALTKAVEAKDQYTNGHSQRVAEYAEKLSIKMNIGDKRIETLKTAALLHDVGKIGIRDDILNKPGKLTHEEFETIKKHPEIGVEILNSVDFLKNAREIILNHHEKYDGTGYPSGLKGDKVPMEAYILSIPKL